MARIKHKLVEPSDAPSGESDAIAIFTRVGWSPEDAEWLGPLCLSFLRAEPLDDSGLDDTAEKNLKLIAAPAKDADPRNRRNRALLIAYVRLCGCGGKNAQLRGPAVGSRLEPPKAPMGLVEWAKIAAVFRAQGAKFEDAIIEGGWPGDYATDNDLDGAIMEFVRDGVHPVYGKPEILRLMHVLADGAALDLTSVIDEGSLVAIGCRRAMPDPVRAPRVPLEIDRKRPPISNARSLTNWMIGLGPRALTKFLPVFQRCPSDEQLAAMAVGVQDAIERWLMCGTHHWTYFREGGPRLADACQPYLQHLEHRCSSGDGEVEPQIRRSWLWFAWCVYEADPNLWQRLGTEAQEQILRAANEDLARLRPLFARAQLKPTAPAVSAGPLLPRETRAPWEEFEWEKEHFRTCAMLLYECGSVWRGMKPLLLAIRSFACACVARDLRHWREALEQDRPGLPGELDQPPQPWSTVPESMISLFHRYVGREQAHDPGLVSLRGELANFCLERLGDRWSKAQRAEAELAGSKRTDDDMVERSPEWRLCLIRAVVSLHINPEGKGHRILLTASQIDPNEDVQEAASAAYEQMRRLRSLPENVSPRRAVMSALWWIRQASLLGLGIRPDPDGAQRTRAKELARTKEAERDDKPAIRDNS